MFGAVPECHLNSDKNFVALIGFAADGSFASGLRQQGPSHME